MTKICAGFVGGFYQVDGNVDRPEQPVQGVLHIAKVQGSGEVY